MDTTFIHGLALLETQDGAKSIKGPAGQDSYNLFNIKDFSGKGGFRAHDKAEGSRDAYRVYNSREESIQDLLSLLERKYPAALTAKAPEEFATALKKGGYATDPLYVTKLTGAIRRAEKMRADGSPELDPATTRAVQDSVLQGEGALGQMTELRRNGWAADIDAAIENGWTPAEIVERIAGAQVQEATAARASAEEKGALSRAASGAGAALGDAGRAASQIYSRVTGDDEALQRKQAEQAQINEDLDRRALLSTTAGKVGQVAGQVAPALIPVPGAQLSLIPRLAVQGAAGGALTGALTPTTEDGQFTQNVVQGATTGAVGGGALGATVKGAGMAGRVAQAAARGGRSVDELKAARDTMIANGINPSAADIAPGAARIADGASKNVLGANAFKADQRVFRDAEIARAITSRAGAESDQITSAMVREAQANIGKLYDEALSGVTVRLDDAFLQKLDDVLAKDAQSGLPSLSSRVPSGVVDDLRRMSQEGPVTARRLQEARSTVGREMSAPSTEASAKQALGDIYRTLTETIEGGLPQQNFAKWQKANDQYKHLQPVEAMVRMSGDTGDVSVRQLTNAIKQGRFKNDFERGSAPYQDLQNALMSQRANGASGLEDALFGNTLKLGQMAGGVATGGASLAPAAIAGNMALRILTNPKYRDVLLGLNPVQRAELQRLAATARLGGAGLVVNEEQSE